MSDGKPRIATVSLAGCFGCHMSLLDIDERILDLSLGFFLWIHGRVFAVDFRHAFERLHGRESLFENRAHRSLRRTEGIPKSWIGPGSAHGHAGSGGLPALADRSPDHDSLELVT